MDGPGGGKPWLLFCPVLEDTVDGLAGICGQSYKLLARLPAIQARAIRASEARRKYVFLIHILGSRR